ncbi:hypothetical protein BD408DRAFT_429425 [Parasitella parasitica]|nr:hypothetical protein BD408DRAFT_429425 [Parasitella parasitica]
MAIGEEEELFEEMIEEENEDEGLRSDISNDYHPNRVLNYILEEEEHSNGLEIISELKKLLPQQIYRVLNVSERAVIDNIKIIGWANQLVQAALGSKDWLEIQTITIKFLAMAQESKDKLELIAANILHRLALIMIDNPPNNNVEDSYAHNIISALFDSVFRSDPILSCQWANGFLHGSSQYKPDFVVFVKHSKDRYDIGVSEIKPPSKSNCNNNSESDMVKIGKEMA